MITCILENLPTTIRSFCRENPDGSYTVVINARLTLEGARAAFRHELSHINGGDFTDADTDEIENARHKAGRVRGENTMKK